MFFAGGDHHIAYEAQISHPTGVQGAAGATGFVRVLVDLGAAWFAAAASLMILSMPSSCGLTAFPCRQVMWAQR